MQKGSCYLGNNSKKTKALKKLNYLLINKFSKQNEIYVNKLKIIYKINCTNNSSFYLMHLDISVSIFLIFLYSGSKNGFR